VFRSKKQREVEVAVHAQPVCGGGAIEYASGYCWIRCQIANDGIALLDVRRDCVHDTLRVKLFGTLSSSKP
jgi:hypothetical protein